MRIDRASADSVRAVASNLQPEALAELMALSMWPSPSGMIESLVETKADDPEVLCFSTNRPVAIASLYENRPNVVSMGFFATPELPAISIPITRFVIRQLFPRYREAGVHRIETVSLAANVEAHRWMALLGLKEEARLRKYGRNGEDFLQLAWVQDDRDCSGVADCANYAFIAPVNCGSRATALFTPDVEQ